MVMIIVSKYDQYYDFKQFRASRPSISSISQPTSSDKWNKGRQYSIKWTSNDIDVVDIDLYQGANFVADIADGQDVNGGTYPWDIPITINPDIGYSIRISYTDYPGIFETSETFEILKEAFITVTEPTTGTTVSNGTALDITWTDNIEENVTIELRQNGALIKTIASNTPSDGTYSWTPSASTGTNYVIYVKSTTDPSTVFGVSGVFSIN